MRQDKTRKLKNKTTTRQDKTRKDQDKTREDKTRQDKTRQDKTGREKNVLSSRLWICAPKSIRHVALRTRRNKTKVKG